MASKRIIVLDRPNPGRYRYLLWLDVPVARQVFYANADAVSQWKDALPADVTALKTGAVVELAEDINIGGMTLVQVQAALQGRWTTEQNEMNATGAGNPFQRYGAFWDGTAWTPGGVA